MPKKQIKKVTKNELSVATFEDDGGVGQEEMGKDDYIIPRLKILQALSEQVQTVDGAKAGMIIDNAEEKLIDGSEGIVVLPITYAKTYLEWEPRKQGGGLVDVHKGDYPLNRCKRDDRGQFTNSEGNIIMPCAEYYLYVLNEDGSYNPYALSMHGSQIKKSKKWNTMINQLRVTRANGEGSFNPAMFYRTYKLTTLPESNDQGNWFGWKIAGDKNVTELDNGMELYNDAKAFREQIVAGEVKATAHESEAEAKATVVDTSEEVPF